jgi:arsenate reductase (glutaredoxin)
LLLAAYLNNPMPANIIIYHYPRCRKSRAALEYLQQKGFAHRVRNYFEDRFTEKELEDVLMRLNKKPHELIRIKEVDYLVRYRNKHFSDYEWMRILIEYPNLIRRPIIVSGLKAMIGEKMEDVTAFL